MRSLVLLLSLFLFAIPTLAQDGAIPIPTESEVQLQEKIDSLTSVMISLEDAREDLKNEQRELRSSSAKGREQEITQRIRDLAELIARLEQNFAAIATEVDPRVIDPRMTSEVNWTDQIRELLGPLLSELKRISSRPREISRLRSLIDRSQSRSTQLEEAIVNIEELIHEKPPPEVVKQLKVTLDRLEEQHIRVAAQLRISQGQLSRLENDRQTLSDSVASISNIFFRSRGRNLIVSIVVAFLFWLLLSRIFLYMNNLPQLRGHRNTEKWRFLNVAYMFLTGIGTGAIFLGCLYFFEDWVLLTLALLIVVGIFWTSREALPRYWGQAMLLLNLGAVREGERVIYRGLPYKVHSLNFYSMLINPLLEGGRLRIPVQDLAELRSRVMRSDEPWFLTQKGDWVILGDGTFGQVVSQTIEWVTVEQKGGARKKYVTANFLEKCPTVLSKGFRIESTFGIDYQHQAIATEKVPDLLYAAIEAGIGEHGFGDQLKSLSVQFALADNSSLNLETLAEFSGEAAGNYLVLQRLLQRLAVDCATKNGWVIPFPQRTVHMAQAV